MTQRALTTLATNSGTKVAYCSRRAVSACFAVRPDYETWMMNAINKAIYSTLRDSIEANIGEAAKELLRKAHQVN